MEIAEGLTVPQDYGMDPDAPLGNHFDTDSNVEVQETILPLTQSHLDELQLTFPSLVNSDMNGMDLYLRMRDRVVHNMLDE
jgi:hypothetical protein